MLRAKKHLFFDMDDTVTASRSRMEDDAFELYGSLPCDIIIVSGAQISQIDFQIRNLPLYRLGQNGNQAINPSHEHLWNEFLTDEHMAHIHEHIQKVRAVHGVPVLNEDDLIEHRGAQTSYSLIGHHEVLEKKKLCDPDRAVRLSLLEHVPFEHDELEVKIGGTTCFDYFRRGRHKGFNVQRLIDHMQWDKGACVYFGDALVPGGNDETVMGVIDTVPVNNHRHTYDILREHFAK